MSLVSDEWADLTALEILDLEGNDLSGTVPRSVWAFFDDKIAEGDLNLGDNPMLEPSPALNMSAVVSKIPADQTDAGKTMVTLSFDNIWYTTEVRNHEWRYSADGGTTWGPSEAEDSMGWMSMPTGCDDGATPPVAALCPKDDGATPAVRTRQPIMSAALPDADTYIFDVRAVKTDDGADANVITDDTVTRSEDSRIDVVGPQTLTAESHVQPPGQGGLYGCLVFRRS